MRRRGLWMDVRHFEYAVRDIELAVPRHVDRAAAETDRRMAADDPDRKVGVVNFRQRLHRVQGRAAGLEIDREPVIGHRRAAGMEIRQRRIAGDHRALDDAAGHVLLDPLPHRIGAEDRPYALHHRARHARAGDAEGEMRFGAGKIETAGDGDADIVQGPRVDAGQVALVQIDPVAVGIDAPFHGHAVDRKSVRFERSARRQNNRIDHRIAARRR